MQNLITKWFTKIKKGNRPSVSSTKNCKILFRFYSDVLEQWTVETLWANVVDEEKGLYCLDSIPFYAKSVACEDIVFAEYDADEQFLAFREVVTASGNSTIQIVLMDPSMETNTIRDQFNALGCSSEKFREGYFVLDVPAHLSYGPIMELLDDLMKKTLSIMQKLVFQITIGMKHPSCKQNPNLRDIIPGERQDFAEGDPGILGLNYAISRPNRIQTK